jgi:quinoprotein relay system zinc metallohydrolase 1
MTPPLFSRRASLGLLASAALIRPARATARLAYDLRPQPVAKGVWMIEGSTDYFSMENGGAIVNIALLQGKTGLIVVDTGSSLRYGEALKGLADGLDLRGVSHVINTHHHPDHFFGNQVFADRPIHALGETILQADADADAFADSMYRILGDWMRGTDPVPPRNVISGGEVTIDGRAFLALPLSGHTAGDLALLDRETGILITGDLVFHDRAATTPSADLPVWHAALDTLEGTGAAAVLPGHGPLDRGNTAIPQTRAYLRWLESTLRNSAAEGLDMIEVMDIPLPPDFAKLGAEPQEFHRSVAHLYPAIEREVMPRAN